MDLYERLISGDEKLAVVGLGYVGLPIAVAFAKKIKTIGFDINQQKISEYLNGKDPTQEVGTEVIRKTTLEFTCSEEKLRESKFIIVAVPTPIHTDKTPDLSPVTGACEIVGRNLTKDAIVVFESTVYPGVTEEVCIPILENISGLSCGTDFKIGYSPERINPGDKHHKLNNIIKIVSGIDTEAREIIAKVYELIIDAGVHLVTNIKTAEAAKLVENAQRDINIAFMNELAMVFEKMDINTQEVVEAMNTKWNALGFTPGLVGGHCIGVDPYYFIYQAEKLGYHSQIILSGRKINDGMGSFIGDIVIKKLIKTNKLVNQAKIYILGITFKENCPDIRNSKVIDIINRLKEYDVTVNVVDPVADEKEVKSFYDINMVKLSEVKEADCIIIAVAHNEFRKLSKDDLDQMFRALPAEEKVVIDIKSIFPKSEMEAMGYSYWSL
ncbi:nucleotide sugar dehydrogenase [Lachnoclostridium phytofermentans]|uniref:Nucleotide sugar dehydrogenase n=1 Tax=Lachnoclostridium phytofermentans (strain ATCC 700394 / DSM 18823 / ISDg) TaxID=357809 RepID=A9KK08_LACP7|nr:nucleotide sugar dehydrogenase [Lachnoclostridium phytofermentans]ABX42580.1 nucleotide sugar dehydrogenase [Lachnoclostridium phytofermentans ISDg]